MYFTISVLVAMFLTILAATSPHQLFKPLRKVKVMLTVLSLETATLFVALLRLADVQWLTIWVAAMIVALIIHKAQKRFGEPLPQRHTSH
jgi:hypothetical protein